MNDNFWLHLPDGEQRYPYKLISSNRAKYIRIKISNGGELSIIVPRGVAAKHAHGFIEKKSQWVAKNLKNCVSLDKKQFPTFLELNLLNECWNINYSERNNSLIFQVELEEQLNNQLEIKGNIENWEFTKAALNKWCRLKSKDIFREMLEMLAEKHGFHFNRLTIRSQKTRWGSCSAKKNINLNSKLILMPKNVVEYVMIHELCHTIEMNHSSSFWQLVEECDADYKKNRKQLKALGKAVVL